MKSTNSTKTLHQFARRLSGDPVSFKVHYWAEQPQHPDNLQHKHSFFEICYVLGGKGIYWEVGQEFLLQEGTIFCSRPDKLHQIHKCENLYLLYVAFEIDQAASQKEGIYLFEQLAQSPYFFDSDAGDSPPASIWRALMQHSESSHLPLTELIESLAYSLLLSLQTLFCKTDLNRGRQQLYTNSSSLLYQAKLFIKDNLAQRLSLEYVATQLHISQRHLSRLFSDLDGKPFTDFVRSERVNAAAELLRSTDRTIKSISEETGFSTVHYFTKVFFDETNFTPGGYRKIGK